MPDKRLILITTGGTIAAKVDNGALVSSSELSDPIVQLLQKFAANDDVEIVSYSPISKLSEDLTPADWKSIIASIWGLYSQGERNFIVTHGTDTMSYTVFSTEMCRKLYPEAKICFTGSFISPSEENSDWEINVLGAYKLLQLPDLPAGVFLAFRQMDSIEKGCIISSIDLKPMGFDDTCFHPAFGHLFATYDDRQFNIVESESSSSYPGRLALERLWERLPISSLDSLDIEKSSKEIIYINAYPGMNLSALKPVLQSFRSIVISMYHSGTVSSGENTESLVEFTRGIGRSTHVFCCVLPTRYIPKPYKSTVNFMNAGGVVVKDMQPHQLYLFLAWVLASGADIEQALSCLSAEDIIMQN